MPEEEEEIKTTCYTVGERVKFERGKLILRYTSDVCIT
jgi:hypothetical protein